MGKLLVSWIDLTCRMSLTALGIGTVTFRQIGGRSKGVNTCLFSCAGISGLVSGPQAQKLGFSPDVFGPSDQIGSGFINNFSGCLVEDGDKELTLALS